MLNVSNCLTFEIPTPVTVRVTLFWVCRSVDWWIGASGLSSCYLLSSEHRILKTEMVISPETFVLSVGLQGMLLYTEAVFLFLTYHYSDSMNKNCVQMETIHILLSAIFPTATCITFEVN